MRFSKAAILSVVALFTSISSVATAQTGAGTMVLEDVRVIDGTGHAPIDHVSILIRNGKISDVVKGGARSWPAGAKVMKLSGKTVMPGIINGHGHVGLVKNDSVSPKNYTSQNVRAQLEQYERYGVTTTVSLGMNKDLLYRIRADQEKGGTGGATVLTADRGIGVPGGVPAVKVGPDQIYRPPTPDEARKDVQEMEARAPNLIKVWVDDSLHTLPPPNPDVYGAVIDEAHKKPNLRVAAHLFYLADAKKLLADGVDIFAHSVRDKEIDSETVSRLKERNVYYIPTLQLEESFYVFADHPAWMDADFFKEALSGKLAKELNSEGYKKKVQSAKGTPGHQGALHIAMLNLKKVHDSGAPVAFGTDSGANPYRIQGWAEHRELQLMVEAGMTPLAAIHSATEVNAKMLQISEKTGTIAAGKQADLLVLNADPSQKIENTEKIALVFHDGRQIKPAFKKGE